MAEETDKGKRVDREKYAIGKSVVEYEYQPSGGQERKSWR